MFNNVEAKENLITMLDAGAHFMYSSNLNAEDFLQGDALKVMYIANLFHFAFPYKNAEKNNNIPEYEFSVPDFEGHGLDVFVEEGDDWDGGWMYLGGAAPCKEAIVEAVEVITDHNHPKRKWLGLWGVPELLDVNPRFLS